MSQPLLQTVVYVFRDDGKAMLGYQPMSAPFCAGKLKAPGGRVQPNESPKDCAVRETVEETSVTPNLPEESLGIVNISYHGGPTVRLYVYRTTNYSGEPQSVEKLEKVGWYDVNEDTIVQMMDDNRSWIGYVQRNELFTAEVVYDQHATLIRSEAHPIS